MLTYIGRGYSPAFTANYDRVIARLVAGEDILIEEGPDDICQPLLATTEPHCLRDSVVERDTKAMHDVADLLGRPLQVGATINLEAMTVRKFRDAFAKGQTRRACIGCEWFELCSAISKANYQGTKLKFE
ncbi:DUF1284 domain-containing protein [Candidatus Phyllobacterium onerii]|uniref:DUF1284 domain-containing protein n=1 Tax=Candidatus Phyllobacterium onerii TaxID=3020828 RepID=UPI002FEE317A